MVALSRQMELEASQEPPMVSIMVSRHPSCASFVMSQNQCNPRLRMEELLNCTWRRLKSEAK